MKRILLSLLEDRVALIGSAGTAWTVALKHIHTTVGILVGLLTVVYLTIKIRQELNRKNDD
ncbi:hypothetical protein [Pelagicoccus mobilis]|uniref:Uncharacterized protein n=1 Tax=Pelagicoccus mobilis TaxID=415221 RepID=A0A934S1S4_9BACT|nr:hypothetical protein [Pelagicoccus mobilis]MBK1880757.1 hypothetical protein [Pelagicoccus mobilis]